MFAQGGEQQQVGDLRAVLRIPRDVTVSVGLGLLDKLCGLICGHTELDGITLRLAHLGAVQAENVRSRRQQCFRLGKDGLGGLGAPVPLVETTRDDTGLLDVGKLITPDGNKVRLTEEDVSGLMYREGEHETGHRTL